MRRRKRGGSRRGSGAPAGNRNGAKSLPWLESYDLASSDGVRGFLVQIVRRTWTGELGSRQAGALNGTMRLILEHDLLPELEKRIKSLEGMKTN
jgi:hypothetical protein